jgi:hypothetical protein
MELTPDNVTNIVKHYGYYQWSGTDEERNSIPSSGHYSFTTHNFSGWYAVVREVNAPPLYPQPSFQEINSALKNHPRCQQVCSNLDFSTSWKWQLQP